MLALSIFNVLNLNKNIDKFGNGKSFYMAKGAYWYLIYNFQAHFQIEFKENLNFIHYTKSCLKKYIEKLSLIRTFHI